MTWSSMNINTTCPSTYIVNWYEIMYPRVRII